MAEAKNEFNKNEKPEKPDNDYWRSFKDLFHDTSLLEANRHEFQEGVTDDFNISKLSPLSRRKFLALVGASAALAGVGCSDYRNKGDIVPYNKMPEEVIVGKANYYASTSTACNDSCGILIKTREGRPIKIDGNPDHPVSKGKTCAKCQANILSLYDPQRLQEPMRKSSNGKFIKSTWQHVDQEIISALTKSSGKEIAIVTHRIISPTAKKAIDDFKEKYPGTKIYSYNLFNDSVRNSAWKKCYGAESFPLIKWDKAKIIVGLESDFLGLDGNKVETARMFAGKRDFKNPKDYNRLYVFEGNLSVTGMNADYRFRLRPDAQYEFVMSLISELKSNGLSVNGIDDQILNIYSLDSFAKKYSLSSKKLKRLSKDLLENKGAGIIHAGNSLPEHVHIAVNYLNEIIGAANLYRTDTSTVNLVKYSDEKDWTNLVQSMKSGNVGAVIHFNSNPAFHLPDDLGYKKAIKKVPAVISLVESENESSALGHYTLPIHHDLESWGDAKTRTGFYSFQQPVIDPLFNSRQKEAALLVWASGKSSSYEPTIYHKYLMQNWQNDIYPKFNSKLSFNEFWNSGLHDGVAFINETPAKMGTFDKTSLSNLPNDAGDTSGYLVVLKDSYQAGDGKFLNNGWMMEFPHPVSKITWDNYAAISHTTAKELGVDSNDKIKIQVDDRTLEIPAFIQPGAADKTITIELGFGRTVVGVVGEDVGFNAITLTSKNNGVSKWIYKAKSVTKGNGTYKLISSVEHHMFGDSMTHDLGKSRGIIREGTVEEYVKNPNFIKEQFEEVKESLYDKHLYPGVKWAMAVDMNKCIGCGECVISCNVENNIPVVGKDQVANSREMQWLRVDRYYSGTIDEPVSSNQLMLCQQCDDAPCENVCPVAATTHSPDGLNQMIYNRCIGTRFCSNNCPYKVRRFNFFNFRDHFKDAYQQSNLLSLVNNPEVTVRSRGVMEKCTFCIQRIMEARSDAIRENRTLKGSDVKTACQEACNTEAIQFGDMNDKDSEFVSKYRDNKLGYYVLEDLNTKPNVTYLAKLRNTHTEEV